MGGMRFSHFFIARPIFAAVLSLFITLLGGISYFGLAVTQFPEIVPPTITVTTTYPGASAQTVADTVASVIELEVNGVDGMLYMYSNSTSDGTMNLTVTFDVGTDIDMAQVQVQNRVASAEPRLPEEVRRNGILVRKNNPDQLLAVHLISPDNTFDQIYISNYALLNVRDVLARIEGVGSVAMYGAREYAMRIWLDPERIAGFNLSADDVLRALRAQNVQVAGGAIGEPPIGSDRAFQMPLQVKGRLLDASEFEEIIIKAGADGRIVRLRDVARVELGALNYNSFGYMNHYPATVLSLTQAPGTDALKTANEIKRTMAELAKNFPKGLEYRIVYNPTEFIEVSIRELYKTILEAVALVVVVIVLFLQTWRASLIPVLAIPVSLIGTFAVMQAFGFSINMLTLFGLVLAVGIVVDDAIVVVENIARRLREGLSPVEAARVSMDEVGTALIAIAIVLSAVFIPTAFVGGITGQFYRQFALTIATATIISAFVSLTLSPALAAILFRRDYEGVPRRSRMRRLLAAPVTAFFRAFNRGFDALSRGYGRLIKRLARVSTLMLVVYAALIGATLWLLQSTPTGFIPPLDRGFAIVSVQLPPGAALERTNQVMRRANELVHSTLGVISTNVVVGRSGATFTAASSAGAIFVVLDSFENRSRQGLTVERVANEIRQKLSREIQEAQTFVIVPPPVRGIGSSGGFAMRLQDRAGIGSLELNRVAQELIRAANARPEIVNTFTTFHTSTPQVFVDVDRTKARMLNVPIDNIFEALRIYMGSAYVNDFNMFGRTFRVTIQADGPFRLDVENVGRIRVPNADGEMVPLSSVATFREISGPDRVPRYNLFPTVEITGAGAPGVSSGQALEIMHEVAAEVLPEGVTYEWTDLSYQEVRAGRTGYYIFLLSVVFVFLALAAQYESWSLPLAIMLIVPMCLLSALIGVRLHAQDINILTQIAFVVLIGLAAKNAILIVEFARQIEEQGKDRVTAAVEAGQLRLRPILMTSLAFTCGVLPLYFASGAGAEMRIALGTAVFWGMIGVTFFGLIFTPVFYVVVRGFASRRKSAVTSPQPAE